MAQGFPYKGVCFVPDKEDELLKLSIKYSNTNPPVFQVMYVDNSLGHTIGGVTAEGQSLTQVAPGDKFTLVNYDNLQKVADVPYVWLRTARLRAVGYFGANSCLIPRRGEGIGGRHASDIVQMSDNVLWLRYLGNKKCVRLTHGIANFVYYKSGGVYRVVIWNEDGKRCEYEALAGQMLFRKLDKPNTHGISVKIEDLRDMMFR